MSNPEGPEHSPDLSWREIFGRPRICVVNVSVVQHVYVLAPDNFDKIAEDSDVIAGAGHAENPIEPFEFSFDDVRSGRMYRLCKEAISSCGVLHPDTKQYLVDNVVECGRSLASLRPENDVDCGYVIDAGIEVTYYRVADEEELAPFRQFDDMDDEDEDEDEDEDDDEYDDMDEDDGIEDIDEDEAHLNPSFRGVEKGRYDGGEGKEVITCSVCLEDLSSGMEFEKLPCCHVFHSTCIDPWLRKNGSCPNCRTRLTKLEEQGVWSDFEACVW